MTTKPRSIVAHFRMTEVDANSFLRVARRFPSVSHASLTLRAFQIGVAALEGDPGLFAVVPEPDEPEPVPNTNAAAEDEPAEVPAETETEASP